MDNNTNGYVKSDNYKPFSENNNIPIIYSTSDLFSPLVAASIKSLIEHSSSDKFYDIYVLHSGLKQVSMDCITSVYKSTNLRIVFIDISEVIKNYDIQSVINTITVETFYRLLIPDIFSNYEKILYIDADTIINKDISLLFDENMDGYMVAGIHDYGVIARYYHEGPFKEYMDNTLKVIPEEYVQDGVMLFNIKEINSAFDSFSFISSVNKVRMSDQDAINILCKNHIKYLNPQWNAMYKCYDNLDEYLKKRLSDDQYDEYSMSIEDPYIVHYVGDMKPWDGYCDGYSRFYWDTIRNSYLYEKNIIHLVETKSNKKINSRTMLKSFIKGLFNNDMWKLY